MKIMVAGIFKDKPDYNKFLIVVGIVLFITGIFTISAAFLANIFYGVDVLNDPTVLDNLQDPRVLHAMRLVQIFSTGFGMFIFPAFVIAFLFSTRPLDYLYIKKHLNIKQVGLTVLTLVVSIPFMNVIISFNQQLELPDYLSGVEQWIMQSEKSATYITESFLKMNTTGDLYMNLFMMALLPAIGEELIFRGVLYRLIKNLTGNIHVAVMLAAFVFSAFHMQFYGFVPRLLLGVAFGYMLVWSGNIWLPIIAHFVNNAAAVIFAWYAGMGELPFNQDSIGTAEGEWKLAVVSLVLVVMMLALLKRAAGSDVESTI
jgi:CAAX protease family protein